MHGDVGVTARQRFFELFHEQTFAADRCERGAQLAIAFGRHAENADFDVRIQLGDPRFDEARLPHCKCGFARRNDECAGQNCGATAGHREERRRDLLRL